MRLALLLAALVLAGCAQPSDGPAPDVAASFYPLAFLASSIAGDNVTVRAIIPAGIEPHDYDPTPLDVKHAHDAKVVIVQGASFESWVGTITEGSSARVVVATEGLPLRENPDGEEREEIPQDPHTWLDPVLYANMSRTIEDALVAEFPEHEGSFRARGESLRADLARLDAELREGLATCESRVFITTHAAFGYLAARYDLTMVSLSGLDPESEPTPEAIRHAIEVAREHDATTIYFEELVSPRVAETVANEVGATTRVLSPVEGILPEEAASGASYMTLMRENLAALREGLRCT